MTLKRLLYEVSGFISWLILLAFILVMAVLIKDGVIANTRLVENKDVFDATWKITATLVLIIGGILSYVRFFGGQALRPKLILKLQSGVIPIDKKFLHWIEIEIQNVGSSSIWNYRIRIYATHHGPNLYRDEVTDFVSAPRDLKIQEQFVDVGESAFEHALVFVPPHVSAVTFQVVLTDEKGAMWTRCLTLKNSESRDG